MLLDSSNRKAEMDHFYFGCNNFKMYENNHQGLFMVMRKIIPNGYRMFEIEEFHVGYSTMYEIYTKEKEYNEKLG